MDFGSSVAGSGLTAALIGLIYGLSRILKRSQCSSHNNCCEFEIARELEKAQTERDSHMELIKVLVAKLNAGEGSLTPPSLGEPDREEGAHQV
jgi:hypothetical protein